jgi:hypothetical protein
VIVMNAVIKDNLFSMFFSKKAVTNQILIIIVIFILLMMVLGIYLSKNIAPLLPSVGG